MILNALLYTYIKPAVAEAWVGPSVACVSLSVCVSTVCVSLSVSMRDLKGIKLLELPTRQKSLGYTVQSMSKTYSTWLVLGKH